MGVDRTAPKSNTNPPTVTGSCRQFTLELEIPAGKLESEPESLSHWHGPIRYGERLA